jgi:hypothetical protein
MELHVATLTLGGLAIKFIILIGISGVMLIIFIIIIILEEVMIEISNFI